MICHAITVSNFIIKKKNKLLWEFFLSIIDNMFLNLVPIKWYLPISLICNYVYTIVIAVKYYCRLYSIKT